jgi:hypothetical protein
MAEGNSEQGGDHYQTSQWLPLLKFMSAQSISLLGINSTSLPLIGLVDAHLFIFTDLVQRRIRTDLRKGGQQEYLSYPRFETGLLLMMG